MLLFGTLLLLLTAPSAVSGDQTASVTVRVGENVILPCGNVIKNQQNCDSTSWLHSSGFGITSEELITHGNISRNKAKAKSERLSVTEDCSLVIKRVTREDVGRYTCRQFTPGEEDSDALVFLSMITIDTDDAQRFYCNVFSYGRCEHTIQWHYTEDDNELSVTQGACSAIMTFKNAAQRSDYDHLFCKVTDKKSGQTLQCDPFSESCQKSESKEDTSSEKGGNTGDQTPPDTKTPGWLPFVVAAVGLAAFIVFILVMVFIRRKKSNGNEIQREDIAEQSLNPAATQSGPVTGQEKEDPEDIVAYASISYTKQGHSKGRAGGDDDGAVTYSTVKASSPNNQTSVDPSGLYATVNKPNKKKTTS